MQVTIKDIARALSLSPATVSLALNDSPMVNPDTARKVKEEARRQNYVPNQYARSLARGRSGMMALVVPEIRNYYFASLVKYATEASRLAGYEMTTFITNESLEDERRIMRKLLQQNMEAVILAPVDTPVEDAEYKKWISSLNIPVIFATSRYSGVELPCVMNDLRGGMNAITEHICRLKCKRIALMTGAEGVYTFQLREEGYHAALKAHDLAPVVWRVDNVSYVDAYECVMNMADLPDAIICVNDLMALGALNALIARGVSVPGDVCLAGYDNSIYSRVAAVPITTVEQDVRRISEALVEMARARIDAHDAVAQDVILPYTILERRSTMR